MFGFIKRMQQQAENINLYFTDAAKLFAFENNEAAGLAALTAAKVAASVQRHSMVQYVVGFASDIERMDEAASKRLLLLGGMITEKDWSVTDAARSKTELKHVDENMLHALEKSDGQYFRNAYPAFFKDW